MKNILFNVCQSVPFYSHDFFFRTLANAAQAPFDLKPYAPWIMRFIWSRMTINYKADKANHLSYLPLVEILQSTIASVLGKGKSIINEGHRPLDTQFHQPASQSTGEAIASQTTGTNASQEEMPKAEAPRVMTDRELLISLHQKVDQNHDWVK